MQTAVNVILCQALYKSPFNFVYSVPSTNNATLKIELHKFTLKGCVEVVRQLLDRGLDEQHRDNSGWTPLHYAAFEGGLTYFKCSDKVSNKTLIRKVTKTCAKRCLKLEQEWTRLIMRAKPHLP